MTRIKRFGNWLGGLVFAACFVPAMALVAVASPFRLRRYRRFRRAAEGIQPGDSRDAVASTLKAAGARRARDEGKIARWSRLKGPFFSGGRVAVQFDDAGRVRRSWYDEDSRAA